MSNESSLSHPKRQNKVMSKDKRTQILHDMVRIRMVEEEIARRYSEQEMRCPTHLCIGQEAVPVVVSSFLKKNDLVFSGHRSHGHYLAKGGNLNSMLAELYGKSTGCARGKGGSQHLIDLECNFMGSAPILSSTISVAVGAAWAEKYNDIGSVTVCYFGDGATEEGNFHEAMNFASIKSLPVIFVCENNLYSVHSAMDVRQPAGRKISEIASAHGMLGATCDGNNVEEIAAWVELAISRAREGQGPTLIECLTYRHLEHCGPNEDNDLGYRSKTEVEAWLASDPIEKLKETNTPDQRRSLELWVEQVEVEIEKAFVFAKTSSFPEASELFSHLYPVSGE